jgi:hypothetical protein
MAVDAATMAEATTQADTTVTAAPPSEVTADTSADAAAEDIWAKVLELDPEELIRKNPKLQGKLGALAQLLGQRYAQETSQRYEQQIAEGRERERIANERAERKRLAENDPDALAARVLADEARTEFQEQQRQLLERQRSEMSRSLATRLDAFTQKPIFAEAWEAATPDERKKLDWTNYREIDDFFADAAEVISEHRASKKADALSAKRLEAARKESAIEGVKAEAANGRADLNLDGMSTGEHIFSESEIRANIGNAAWRKANLSKINQQAAAGLIRQE